MRCENPRIPAAPWKGARRGRLGHDSCTGLGQDSRVRPGQQRRQQPLWTAAACCRLHPAACCGGKRLRFAPSLRTTGAQIRDTIESQGWFTPAGLAQESGSRAAAVHVDSLPCRTNSKLGSSACLRQPCAHPQPSWHRESITRRLRLPHFFPSPALSFALALAFPLPFPGPSGWSSSPQSLRAGPTHSST